MKMKMKTLTTEEIEIQAEIDKGYTPEEFLESLIALRNNYVESIKALDELLEEHTVVSLGDAVESPSYEISSDKNISELYSSWAD